MSDGYSGSSGHTAQTFSRWRRRIPRRARCLPAFILACAALLSGCGPANRMAQSTPSTRPTTRLEDAVGKGDDLPVLRGGIAAPALPVEPAAPARTVLGPPSTQPAATEPALPEFKRVADILGRAGVSTAQGAVYTITFPRDDLELAVEGVEVPVAAGLESVFHFSAGCCGGKVDLLGQFCVLDYEMNDVIDAVRAAHIEIVSVGPMVLHTRDHVLALRLQAEGRPEELAKGLREALRWIGKERLAPEPGVKMGPQE